MLKDVIIIDGKRHGRADLEDRQARGASGLRSMGIGEGDTVAGLMRNDIAFFETQGAAGLVGSYFVPLNWHNKPDELAYILGDCSPKVLVAHADLLVASSEVLPDDMHVFVVPVEGAAAGDETTRAALAAIPGARVWSDMLADQPPIADPIDTKVGAIIYTSGTTGRPKGVFKEPMPPELWTKFQDQQREIFGVGPGARALVLGPLYHSSPNSNAAAAIATAELTVMQSKFDPEQVLAAIQQYSISHVVLVPTMFVRLLRLPEEIRARYDVSSLRSATHTGGPCAPDVKRAMIAWWGPVLNEVYGGTEMGCVAFCSSQEWLQHPGTVGRLLDGTQLELIGADGSPVERGEVGEIFARNPHYGDFTYIGREQDRRDAERNGLFTLGDMGRLDDDGYLYLADRKRDMVISGGVNIYPAEIESVLIGHPDVVDCAVFGVPDEDFGERLVAAVQLASGEPDSAGISAYLRERLTDYKVPREFLYPEQMPREESGKLFKRRLRDAYLRGSVEAR